MLDASVVDVTPIDNPLNTPQEPQHFIFTVTSKVGKRSEPLDLACDTEAVRERSGFKMENITIIIFLFD